MIATQMIAPYLEGHYCNADGQCIGKMVIIGYAFFFFTFFWGGCSVLRQPQCSNVSTSGRDSVEACWHAMAAVKGNISTCWHALHHQTFNVQAPLGFQSWNIEIWEIHAYS